MTAYKILVDDYAREDTPDEPWTALVLNADEQTIGSGFGELPGNAVRNALSRLHDSEDDQADAFLNGL